MAQRSTPYAATLPYWSDSASVPTFPQIDRDVDVDVLVVGGGITGLTTAYLLLDSGTSVAVLERARCGQIDTGHTSAHLTMVTDTRLSELVRRFGRDHAQAVWDAGLAAIAQIETIVREQSDRLRVRVGGRLPARAERRDARGRPRGFEEEATLARDLGFDATFVDDVPFAGGPGVRFDDQARFHPRKYLAGLAGAIRDEGGLIFEHSDADGILRRPASGEGQRTLGARAGHRAGHAQSARRHEQPRRCRRSSRRSSRSTRATSSPDALPKGVVPDALFWDTADPYHYLRIEPHRDHDLVIFGGEDHKTGQVADTSACYDRLEQDACARWSRESR